MTTRMIERFVKGASDVEIVMGGSVARVVGFGFTQHPHGRREPIAVFVEAPDFRGRAPIKLTIERFLSFPTVAELEGAV